MIPPCSSCCYSRPHGAGYVECLAAGRQFGPDASYYLREDSPCTLRPILWRPILVREAAAC